MARKRRAKKEPSVYIPHVEIERAFVNFENYKEILKRLYALFIQERTYDPHTIGPGTGRLAEATDKAFYQAWSHIWCERFPDLPLPGLKVFRVQYARALTAARVQEHVVSEYLEPFRPYTKLDGNTRDRMDAGKLLEAAFRMITTGPAALPEGTNVLQAAEHQARLELRHESLRDFTLALQLLDLELLDPDTTVSRDMDYIAETFENRVARKILRLSVAFARNARTRRVMGPALVAYDEASHARNKQELRKTFPDAHIQEDRRICRVVQVKEVTYLVEMRTRRKRPGACLRKLEDVGDLRDTRGALAIVWARFGDKQEKLIHATRADAEVLLNHLRERVWDVPPFSLTSSPERSRRDTDPEYWDVRLHALLSVNGPSPRQVMVEQLVTTLYDRLTMEQAPTPLNYRIRRALQVHRLLEWYWPSHIYGVPWDNPQVMDRLQRYWVERFAPLPQSLP